MGLGRAKIALSGLCMALSGCVAFAPGVGDSLRPVERPASLVADTPYTPSYTSQRLTRYFAKIERERRAQGLLRTDDGTRDAPYSAETLAANFIDIALFDEHPTKVPGASGDSAATNLSRWIDPVIVTLVFGESVAPTRRKEYEIATQSYLARLSSVTQHPIRYTTNVNSANFPILVVDDDELQQSGPQIEALLPGIDQKTVQSAVSMWNIIPCFVIAFSPGQDPHYSAALSVIRSEHSPDYWLTCLHEEVAQGLGLPNDSRTARPTIFNDDEEFGLLTRHDEQLLQILYDPRLQPGMTATDATPIVNTIAAELVGQLPAHPALPGGPA